MSRHSFSIHQFVCLEVLRLKAAPAIRLEWARHGALADYLEARDPRFEGPAEIVPMSAEMMALLRGEPSIKDLERQIQQDFSRDYAFYMEELRQRLKDEARLNLPR